MGQIKPLTPEVANLIAAGEVVENIESVVKELVENSIDAHATEISVDLVESGLHEIRITDNGDGMDEADLKLSIKRHATSKIVRSDDLFRVLSLGFRGEALASLAAVAELSIASSPIKAPSKVLTVQGTSQGLSEGKAFKGTQIIAKNLFYQTPARLKYLKSPSQELTGVLDQMFHLAIAHPSIAFRLSNDGHPLLNTQGNGDIQRVLFDLYGASIMQQMHPFSLNDRDYTIEGWYADPMIQRSTSKRMHLFVNGRSVRNRSLISALKDAYAPYIPKAKYPVVVVFLTCDPILVDVNIHPQKKEIKVAEEKRLKSTLTDGLARHLKKTSKAATFLRAPQSKPEALRFESLHETPSLSVAESSGGIQASKKPFPVLEYVGQVHGTYLVMQSASGMYLMDQHAAAERIRYEKYYAHMQEDLGKSTALLTPLEIPLSKIETTHLADHLDAFESFGLRVSLDDHTLYVHEIPHYFHPGLEYAYTLTMIEHLIEEKNLTRGDLIDQMAKDLSCKHSIKGNQKISRSEVEALLTDLAQCAHPFQCPHGRPTLIEFTQASLENMFGRSMA